MKLLRAPLIAVWLGVLLLGTLAACAQTQGTGENSQPIIGSAEGEATPAGRLSPDEALVEIKKLGGVLVHYDDRLPGNPVTMIDATNLLRFRDEWTRYFAAFPELKQVGLSGTPLTDAGLASLTEVASLDALFLSQTKITDAGLVKLAGCTQLRFLDVSGTRVTKAGIASLRKALPQLEIMVEPEKSAAVVDAPVDPANAARVAKFTAHQIRSWRQKLVELSALPMDTPNGWSKSRIDPARLLTVFPRLRLREGYLLRAYIFKEDGNSNGFVWALPADAAYPEPEECPRVESHFLHPPKPLDALDDVMEAIGGDDSPESYFQASLLRRELKEFGGGWHGIVWGMHTVLDDNPWKARARDDEESMSMYPTSLPSEWKWFTPQPTTWTPEVRLEQNQASVRFYSYTALYAERDDNEIEKERIIQHTETYRRGKYRPLVVEKKLAEGPNAVAH